ncbi:hypothetical protein ACO1LT_15730, partial [Staphylococcus aureus]
FFQLKVPAKKITLWVTSINYKPLQLIVTPQDNELSITLSPEENVMQRLVVTGYTQQSRSKTTGAVNTIKGNAYENSPASSF